MNRSSGAAIIGKMDIFCLETTLTYEASHVMGSVMGCLGIKCDNDSNKVNISHQLLQTSF